MVEKCPCYNCLILPSCQQVLSDSKLSFYNNVIPKCSLIREYLQIRNNGFSNIHFLYEGPASLFRHRISILEKILNFELMRTKIMEESYDTCNRRSSCRI